MADKIAIKFIRPSLPYNTGETAWFGELQATSFIKQGFAVPDKTAGEYQPPKNRADILAEEEARNAAANKKRAAAAA